jgi:hypothetical protein
MLNLLLYYGRQQEALGIVGDVGEIGVYLGRYFTMLHLLSRPTENALAIDVFADDASNFDVTGGAAVLDVFVEHVRQNVGDQALRRLRIVKGDSLYLNPDDLRPHMATGRFRLLSIDGAHSWYHTASDLALADALSHSGSIVVLDDITNAGWPGVMNGMARYLLLTPDRRLEPFMMSENKLWFTTRDYHERFLAHAVSDVVPVNPGRLKRVSEFFGTRIVGF